MNETLYEDCQRSTRIHPPVRLPTLRRCRDQAKADMHALDEVWESLWRPRRKRKHTLCIVSPSR